jgi:hypothetical protein
MGEETTTYTSIYCIYTEHTNELQLEDLQVAG